MSELERQTKDFTVEERGVLLKQFHQSGLKFEEFAREHNINKNTFKNWVWLSKSPSGGVKRYTPVEKKKIVESFLSSDTTKEMFCKTWGVSSATLNSWLERYELYGSEGLVSKPKKPGDKRMGSKIPECVQSEIIKIKKKEPSYGLKKIKHWMYRFRGVKVSTGSVRKTVVGGGLSLVKTKKKRRKSSDRVRRFERAKPMQLWQSDITQMTVGAHSMRVYLTVFMDDHSRYIVGWRLQSRQTAELVLDAFKDACVRFGKPTEVLTDQGRQYFAWRGKSELEKLLEKENIKHVVSRAHHPQTLGKCERFWETVANEFWTRVRPHDLDEARERLKYFIDHYNHQRPHQGLDGQVPADRFFGIAEEVRQSIERTVKENSIRIAVGELPRPPAFLIGQVGDQRIAFHGKSGSFFLTHENLQGESDAITGTNESRSSESGTIRDHEIRKDIDTARDGDTTGDAANSSGKKELSAKDIVEAAEGVASDRGAVGLAKGLGSRQVASAEAICNDYGVLDGSDDEVRGGNELGIKADTLLAVEQPSYFRNECRTFENYRAQEGYYE